MGVGVRHCPVHAQLDECFQLDITPQSPSITPGPVMSAPCLFQQALLSLLLASWAFPEHLCGQMVHPHLGSLLQESESSPFGHTFLIPLWACRGLHHPALNLVSRSTKL